MLSGRLVHLIETHWEDILASVIYRIRLEPGMEHYRATVEADLREWGRILLENLSHWLHAGGEEEIAKRYEQIGRLRYEENIPMHESVHILCIIRERVLDFVEEHVYSKNTLALYEQEELDRRMGRFFDLLTVHMVKGYEQALRRQRAAANVT